jgi:SAM-dependent methyltransferase
MKPAPHITADSENVGLTPVRLVSTLQQHRRAWEQRPLLRAVYREWFGRIVQQLSDKPGLSVELGAGIGAFKEYWPEIVTTDIAATPWVSQVVDAQALPYPDESLVNLVLIDVLHHLPYPMKFLSEANRVLRCGGRVVILEPYCSPVSTIANKLFHEERTDLSIDPFGEPPLSSPAPYDANQAVATLLFWRRLDQFRKLYPDLLVRHRSRFSLVLYPLSGGFTKRSLLPGSLVGMAERLERMIAVGAPLCAFRCLVTLERR